MSRAAVVELARILDETEEADEALRQVVGLLVAQDGVAWAGIAFLEDGTLQLGPAAGTPDEARRTRVPVRFDTDHVGELLVDGQVDDDLVRLVAERIGPLVLIGWDTGGEAWEP